MALLAIFALGAIFLIGRALLVPPSTYRKARVESLAYESDFPTPGGLGAFAASCFKIIDWFHVTALHQQCDPVAFKNKKIGEIESLAERHEVGEILHDLIQKDGAGSWPPNANHDNSTWPAALRAYMDIYLEMAPLLPQATPSLDDEVNVARISAFRLRFQDLLRERVDVVAVTKLLVAVSAGGWAELPRDVYNAFYCCIASSRHAYRWATIPVVKAAQIEKAVNLPIELREPWTLMQQHFGCASEAGNNTSNLVLKFDTNGTYNYEINSGMATNVLAGEETFARIFYDVEVFGVPIYCDMVHAIVAFSRSDTAACAQHVANMTSQLRLVTGSYMENMHDKVIAQSVWLSKIQGFYGWGIGYFDADENAWEKFDGLSGNQVLLFQALDAFLGIDQYLSARDQERNVPRRQRDLCHALRKYSFRGVLSDGGEDENVHRILRDFDAILKRLRVRCWSGATVYEVAMC
ncbi:hypothetical protein ACJQWK_06516 [Exserohilum turcicum]